MTSPPDSSIVAMMDAYAKAVHAKDVDGFAALFDPGVRVFDMWAEWSYDGLDGWRRMAADWFASLGDERVEVEFDEVRTHVSGDLAVAHAFVTYRGLSAAGEELRSMQNRITWALRRTGGGWRVVHEHTSSPADFATGKITKRRPLAP